jgi:hypothetical protein
MREQVEQIDPLFPQRGEFGKYLCHRFMESQNALFDHRQREDVGELLADRHARKDGIAFEVPPALLIREARDQIDDHAPSATDDQGNSMAAPRVDVALDRLADTGQPIRVEAQVARALEVHDVLPLSNCRLTGTGFEASIDHAIARHLSDARHQRRG